jgi:hypothetical protein
MLTRIDNSRPKLSAIGFPVRSKACRSGHNGPVGPCPDICGPNGVRHVLKGNGVAKILPEISTLAPVVRRLLRY